MAKEALFLQACLDSLVGIKTQNTSAHVQAVIDTVRELAPINPQKETREKLNGTLKNLRKQICYWASRGISHEQLEEVIDEFAAMMPPTFSREVYKGDLYRTAAAETRLGGTALQAALAKSVKSYQIAKTMAQNAGGVEMASLKINKCLTFASGAGVSIEFVS